MPPASVDFLEPPDLAVILTGEPERPYLTKWFSAANPALRVAAPGSAQEIATLIDQAELPMVVSFLSPFVLSKWLLLALGGRVYNFHPGSPDYPGRRPACFALYDGATEFGATAHLMTPTGGAGGPILDAELFPIDPAWSLEKLEEQAFLAAVRLIRRLAQPLAASAAPPPPHPHYAWRGAPRSDADVAKLEAGLKTAQGAELERLRRACGVTAGA